MSNTGILIIHYHDSKYTKACLDSLHQSTDPCVVYVLFMQSHEDKVLTEHPIHPVILHSEKNLGFASGNNLLLKRALADGCDHLVLLNNDTKVDPDFLPPLLQALQDPSVGMVSPKIYFSAGNEYHHEMYETQERGQVVWYAGGVIDWNHVHTFHWAVNEVDHGQLAAPTETDFTTGCCVALRADTVTKVGMLDERYFLYYEDTDWSLRVKRHGYKLKFIPDSIVWHANGGSSGGSGSSLQQFYQTRNRLLFGFTYAPLKIKLHLLRQMIGFLRSTDPTVTQAAQAVIGQKWGEKR